MTNTIRWSSKYSKFCIYTLLSFYIYPFHKFIVNSHFTFFSFRSAQSFYFNFKNWPVLLLCLPRPFSRLVEISYHSYLTPSCFTFFFFYNMFCFIRLSSSIPILSTNIPLFRYYLQVKLIPLLNSSILSTPVCVPSSSIFSRRWDLISFLSFSVLFYLLCFPRYSVLSSCLPVF